MPKNKFNFNKLCRNVPAALAASAAENVALNEGNKPGPSGVKPAKRIQKTKTQARPSTSAQRLGPVEKETPSGTNPQMEKKKSRWASRFSFPLPKLGEPGGLDDPLRKGLNGAATRRYLRFINEGFKPEEARARAKPTVQERKHNGKRGSETITPPQKPVVKKPRLGSSAAMPSRSFANAAKCTKVAIVAKKHVEKPLTKEELGQIEEALIDEIVGSKIDESITFGGITFRPGMLLLNCDSQVSVDWLKGITPNLSSWKGQELAVCVGDEIPRDHVATMFLPRSAERSDTSLLELIRAQNRDINMGSWKVLKTKREGGGVLLHVGIDDQSRAQIERQNYLLAFRFGSIPVHGLRKNRTEEEPPSMQSEAGSLMSLADRMANLETDQEARMDTLPEEDDGDVLQQMEELLGEAETSSQTEMLEPGSPNGTLSGNLKTTPGDGSS